VLLSIHIQATEYTNFSNANTALHGLGGLKSDCGVDQEILT